MAGWLTQLGVDARAVSSVLRSMAATAPQELRQVHVPVLIVTGDQDNRGETAGELAALLPDARHVIVPGDHATALDAPEFTQALLEFLAAS